MPLESQSPETVYATKGNISYPITGGIDGTQTAAQLATFAQQRLADAAVSGQNVTIAKLTTGLVAGTVTTSLACTGGTVGAAIPSGAVVSVLSGNQLNTFTTSSTTATGATAVAVNSATPTFSFPVGSLIVYGFAAEVSMPVIGAQ